jgi:SPP1 family predicted phage head-tail adaptor
MVGPASKDFRQRCQFQRRTATVDQFGGNNAGWADYGSSRACNLTPYRAQKRGGAEEVIAARLQGTAVFDLWVRYDSLTSTITPDDRVYDVHNPGVYYNIRFAQDMDSRKQRILMQVELGTAAT